MKKAKLDLVQVATRTDGKPIFWVETGTMPVSRIKKLVKEFHENGCKGNIPTDKSILEVVHASVRDMHDAGVVDKQTMDEFDELCLRNEQTDNKD